MGTEASRSPTNDADVRTNEGSDMQAMRRLAAVVVVAMAALALQAVAAWAHVELEPAAVAPGSVAALTLTVANARSGAGTTTVQLLFPEGTPLTVVDLPPVAGWTATVDGGAVGQPATGVTWARPTAGPGEDPQLPLTLGPFPAEPGRLQFKVIQTYSNGEIARWIDDWPAGAPEPAMPGPVLELQPGAAGEVPVSTAPTTSTTPATTSTTEGTAAPADSSDDDSSAVPIILGIAIAVVVLAGAAFLVIRSRARRA